MSEAKNLIFIEELEVHASVGIYEHEKRHTQKLILSLDIGYLKDTTFHSDDINDTINYEEIIKIINTTIEKQHYNLIETLAESIAANILLMTNIHTLTIDIRKPSVLGSKSKGMLGIRIKRGQ